MFKIDNPGVPTGEKGFVTIATGKEEYYRLAHNLLLSYKYFTKKPLPFALLCDRENEYTSDFDQVVIIEKPYCSYLDKLRLVELAPFEENIFIDADSLAYKDLNGLWDIFEGCPDFCTLGTRLSLQSEKGWFKRCDVGEFQGKVHFCIMFQGGIYFIRHKQNGLDFFSDTCKYILKNYKKFRFKLFPDPEDETIFALASAVCNYPPQMDWKKVFCYLPMSDIRKIDIGKGVLEYTMTRNSETFFYNDKFLVHFGTEATWEPLYKSQVNTLHSLI
jgi:hypothetical protein